MKLPFQILRCAAHIIFWVSIGLIFTQYSFLRPGCYCSAERYKEVLCVLMIAMVVYLNRYLFFPKLFLERKQLLFWCINLFLILFIGFSELQIVESNIFKVHGNKISSKEYSQYLIFVFILVSLRDAAFLAFFFIVWINQNMKKLLLQRQQLLAIENKQIIVNSNEKEILVYIKEIVYISSARNVTSIHLCNGKIINQYHSLTYMEEVLPKHLYLRVNRSNIVMYRYVCQFDEMNVTMRVSDSFGQITIPLQQTKNNEKYYLLKRYAYLENKNRDGEMKNVKKVGKWRNEKDNFGKINENAKQVLALIKKNPSIFASEIKRKLSHFSERNIDRHLKHLKNLGLNEFRGSRKTGGYYPISE